MVQEQARRECSPRYRSRVSRLDSSAQRLVRCDEMQDLVRGLIADLILLSRRTLQSGGGRPEQQHRNDQSDALAMPWHLVWSWLRGAASPIESARAATNACTRGLDCFWQGPPQPKSQPRGPTLTSYDRTRCVWWELHLIRGHVLRQQWHETRYRLAIFGYGTDMLLCLWPWPSSRFSGSFGMNRPGCCV